MSATNGTAHLRSDEEITEQEENEPESWDITDEELEREIRRTLFRAMRGTAKPSETSAASCGVRYLAVKAKLPIPQDDGDLS